MRARALPALVPVAVPHGVHQVVLLHLPSHLRLEDLVPPVFLAQHVSQPSQDRRQRANHVVSVQRGVFLGPLLVPTVQDVISVPLRWVLEGVGGIAHGGRNRPDVDRLRTRPISRRHNLVPRLESKGEEEGKEGLKELTRMRLVAPTCFLITTAITTTNMVAAPAAAAAAIMPLRTMPTNFTTLEFS
eukprot:763908-Hanusia_phi.AAC.9